MVNLICVCWQGHTKGSDDAFSGPKIQHRIYLSEETLLGALDTSLSSSNDDFQNFFSVYINSKNVSILLNTQYRK